MIQVKTIVLVLLLLGTGLFHVSTALAHSDDLIQQEIKAYISDSPELRGVEIEVHVKERLVVLTGQVRLLEQKLVSARIAWTTTGVFQVDNEILVVPKVVFSDAAIERKIKEIVNADERFSVAGVSITVTNGEVSIEAKFLNVSDPSRLKHRVAKIEGVLSIKMNAGIAA